MRFAGDKAEMFLGNSLDLGMVSRQALQNRSDEKSASMNAQAQIAAAKLGAEATEKAGAANASASQFGGIMGGLSSGISGGLGALGKKNTWDTAKSEADSWFKANM
jgi:hypothetical protein